MPPTRLCRDHHTNTFMVSDQRAVWRHRYRPCLAPASGTRAYRLAAGQTSVSTTRASCSRSTRRSTAVHYELQTPLCSGEADATNLHHSRSEKLCRAAKCGRGVFDPAAATLPGAVAQPSPGEFQYGSAGFAGVVDGPLGECFYYRRFGVTRSAVKIRAPAVSDPRSLETDTPCGVSKFMSTVGLVTCTSSRILSKGPKHEFSHSCPHVHRRGLTPCRAHFAPAIHTRDIVT
jgi:hypothetical protein